MKQWTKKTFCRMLENNGYSFSRKGKGSHAIYTNSKGNHITVGLTINPCVARRVIKENHLNTSLFIYGNRNHSISYYILSKFSLYFNSIRGKE